MCWSIVRKSLFLFLAFLVFSHPAWAKFQSLQPGLDYQEIPLENAGTTLHVLRIDLNLFVVKPIVFGSAGSTALTVKEMAAKAGPSPSSTPTFSIRTKNPWDWCCGTEKS